MGGGDAYNQYYTDATALQAASNENVAKEEAEATVEAAKYEADAAIQVAKYDYQARHEETLAYRDTQMEALRVRELEAKLTHKEEMSRIFNVEMQYAQAAKDKGEAEIMDKENDAQEIEYDHEIDEARYSSSNESYWYG